jgi:two-component system, OmpR family, phosphate regulon sensor histidine kinase PhoR
VNPPAKAANPSRKLALILLLLVLLPLLFYSGYEINSLSAGEEVMRDMYRRQLDVILFSLNQHAWDVSSHWAAQLDQALTGRPSERSEAVSAFLARTPALESVTLLDTTLRQWAEYHGEKPGRFLSEEELRAIVTPGKERLQSLLRFRRIDYRKLEPFVAADTAGGDGTIILLFATSGQEGDPEFAAMLFREQGFISRVYAPKLSEMASSEFVITIFKKGSEVPVVSSGDVPEGLGFQRRDLWLFPGHEIGISLRGSTVDETVRIRFRRNLFLILLLDLLLLAGAVIVYRNVRTQTELARAKSSFVSNVSHELRTPLALIRMFAETLAMGRLKSEEKKQEYYATIVRESERLTHLVNNILNFSRMEAGRKEYRKQQADLNEIVHGVLETYAHHLQRQGFALTVEQSSEKLVTALDREAVAEALINLLDNAMKYSKDRKAITVRTQRVAGELVVAVQDQGIGIAPEHHRRIFETFYRVPSGLVHETKGSGLGLSLVKHIMDAHGGRVDVESIPGNGSTFRLVFPDQPVQTPHG